MLTCHDTSSSLGASEFPSFDSYAILILDIPSPVSRCFPGKLHDNFVILSSVDVVFGVSLNRICVDPCNSINTVLNLLGPNVFMGGPRHVPSMAVDVHNLSKINCGIETQPSVASVTNTMPQVPMDKIVALGVKASAAFLAIQCKCIGMIFDS